MLIFRKHDDEQHIKARAQAGRPEGRGMSFIRSDEPKAREGEGAVQDQV
jgi:hypothetical protein